MGEKAQEALKLQFDRQGNAGLQLAHTAIEPGHVAVPS